MIVRSAGLLMFRRRGAAVEVLLAHPGGPFWARRDEAAWTLPKGEIGPDEDPLAAAQREFLEETGFASNPPFLPLGELRQKSGKRITAWAFEGDADPARLVSNLFEVEWPPRSGRLQSFPEVDRVRWCSVEEARRKLIAGQVPFVDALLRTLGAECAADERPAAPGL
ncbi:MAG TPA: NUDIX domain-containing protein [Ramlibacter sp.]|uniref:NUDIX domain-containing protein n=1 Tax=Ramlibacter sp. TaxID=1917967 RepID=UPI002D7F331B|nr:NUDIX domain-containing protein [Ramlibacter sp.]HET8746297.1 NUDIX domain-containing protein [Ramlibacter sp.]